MLKPNGTFWLAIGDEYAAELKVMMQRELGFHCRSWVIWYYTFGVNCTKKFSRSHAHLFHLVKDPKIHVQRESGDPRPDRPAARLWRRPRKPEWPPARRHLDSAAARPARIVSARRRHLVLPARHRHVQGARRAGTAARCPSSFLGRIIRACSNEGELVLDPVRRQRHDAGRGQEARPAVSRLRTFAASTPRASTKRLASIEPGDPLDGAAEPLVSAPSTANGVRLDDRQQRLSQSAGQAAA